MSAASKRVLVVDDEEAISWSLEQALSRAGYSVALAASAEEGLRRAADFRPDVCILDVRLPGVDGLSAMSRFRQVTANAPVVVMTAFGNLSTAVRAVEEGAFEYLTKPFDLDQALSVVARAIQVRTPDRSKESTPFRAFSHQEIIGQSPAMQEVFKRIALAAQGDVPVLITGASGTGKELVARALHRHSPRRDRPFLPVHIAALNPGLVESELFGHVKGAFTGASDNRAGLLSLAEGGTVFLDELAEIPLSVQVKLLRVLEQREYFPVGGNQPASVDVRIVAATHANLSAKVASGEFREDLFFRLNVFPIVLPTLAERREDVLPLAEFFLGRLQPSALPLSIDVITYLRQRTWPGNVRELHNALEHAAILARGGPILPAHFPPVIDQWGGDSRDSLADAVRDWLTNKLAHTDLDVPHDLYAAFLADVEPSLFGEVLRKVDGNLVRAAGWLGLHRATIRKRIASLGLDRGGPTRDRV